MANTDAQDPDFNIKNDANTFRKGNIVFTSEPPTKIKNSELEKPVLYNPRCKSTCSITLIDIGGSNLKNNKPMNDLCEVCCGMRSPSSARRAHSYTTHFCTRVPAKIKFKGRLSRSSSHDHVSSGDMKIFAGSDSGSFESNWSSANYDNVRGHVSRLCAFLERKKFANTQNQCINKSGDVKICGSECSAKECCSSGRNDFLQYAAPQGQRTTANYKSSSDIVENSSISMCTSCQSSDSPYSSFPSTCSHLRSFSLSSSSSQCRCFNNRHSHSYAMDSLDSIYNKSNFSQICAYGSWDHIFSEKTNNLKTQNSMIDERTKRNIKPRFVPESSSDDESDGNTCSSEMGWSFSSSCEQNSYSKQNLNETNTITTGKQNLSVENISTFSDRSNCSFISPFKTDQNRKLDVAEKFGTIVNAFKKPGHHVGPVKNPDCLCDNCLYFYKISNLNL